MLTAKEKAEEAASLPPVIARLSLSPSSSNGSPSVRTPLGTDGGGGESDVFDEVDDTEMQLQNTISHIERLILSSRKVKTLAPDAPASADAAEPREAGARSDSSGGEGDSRSAGGAAGRSGESDGDGGGATASGVGSSRVPRTRIPPKIDRTAMLQRRQSTSFFDTKPVFSARDSSSSFTKMWNGGGTSGSDTDGRPNGAVGGGIGDGIRRPLTSRPAHTRRQTERWGWREGVGAEDVVLETPPTVEDSTGSRSESPSNG